MENTKHHTVICFGEVLWDILPSGAVPGGAPMNVTYHLHKLQKNPALITRIGDDEKGKELKQIFSSKGVCTDFFQLDHQHETGKVYANMNDEHEVVYDIVKPAAWDFISWDESLNKAVSNAEYFIYGSLASRNETSKNTLFQLLESANKKVLDINLRRPHFNQKIVEELISKADFLKLNLSELQLISTWYFNYKELEDQARAVMNKFTLHEIVVTLGAHGAVLFSEGKEYHHQGFKVKVKDTIGSGDAFLAGLISKWIDNSLPQSALQFASGLGAFIAGKTGGCPDYKVEEIDNFIREMK
ncbi:MAG: carbohydrate kinase family protein [Ginsengibacter sp.]